MNNFGNSIGKARFNREHRLDFPGDDIIAARNDAAAAQHAEVAAAEKADADAKWSALTQFGDWAVVADVLRSDGLSGDALVAELAKCQQEAPDASAWMRMNF